MAAAVEQERLAGVEASVVERERAGRAPVAEEKTFRRYDPGQVLLMAPVLQVWVPDGDLAHLVSDLVEVGTLDLSAIYASYEDERGYPPYDPRLMVKLLVYGYANGVMSSRKLERATYDRAVVRVLIGAQHPHRDVAVGLGALALDGTKLRANASRHKAMSYERMVKKERELEAEVAEIRQNVGVLLSEAEATDREEDERFGEDGRGDELPDELRRREQRLVVIREAKAALEAEAAERETARRAELEAEGKQPRAPREGA